MPIHQGHILLDANCQGQGLAPWQRGHWAQNSQCFELNCQVVTSDSPQSPEPGQNILNILLNRREPSQGHWFVQPGEGKAQRRPNYSFLLEQGL